MENTSGRRRRRNTSHPMWPLGELCLVLAVVLGLSVAHGLRAEPLRVAGLQLARPELGDWKRTDTADRSAAVDRGTAPPLIIEVAAEPHAAPSVLALGTGAPPTTTSPVSPLADAAAPSQPQRVLMLGDSMIEPLQQRAAQYFEQAGHKFISVIWYGSRTLDWGTGTRLAKTIQTYAPSYVVVVLGSNELLARDLERRAFRVRAMRRTLGDLPMIWVGPPSWRDDHGFNAMLASELGEHFFRSDQLKFERKSDGIHPTDAAGVVWMDRVAEWLRTRPDQTRLELPPPDVARSRHAPARVWPPPDR